MKYYVIAGEPSGDLHGGKLIREIAKEDATASFRFCGGDLMAATAGEENMCYHYKQMSFFGFVQVAKNLKTILTQIDRVKEASCLQSFPASGSFPMNLLFASGGQRTEASDSASVLPMYIQD